MKIAVIGANGQLGSDLVREFQNKEHEVIGITHRDMRIEDFESVNTVLQRIKPDVILNTAAFHVVTECEEQPDAAFAVNAVGALNVARIADRIGAINIYYSTDYVFDGEKRQPYLESDTPNPLNVYGSTKLVGEYLTLNYSTRSFVIRVSGIYGRVPCRAKGGNFITTMLRLAKEKSEVRVVEDEILTPTPTTAIAEKSVHLVQSGQFGLYHLTSEGQCSWYEFARVIFDTLKIATPLVPTTVKEFQSPVKRPFYSVLENNRYNKEIHGPPMPHWRDALVDFLRSQYA